MASDYITRATTCPGQLISANQLPSASPLRKAQYGDHSVLNLPLIRKHRHRAYSAQRDRQSAVQMLLLKVGFVDGEIPIRHSEIPLRA